MFKTQLGTYTANDCPVCGIVNQASETPISILSDYEIDDLFNQIYFNLVTEFRLPFNVYMRTARQLTEGVTNGYQKTFADVVFGDPDHKMLDAMRTNCYVFSGAKTFQQVRAYIDAITDEKGLVRPFNEYKKIVRPIYDNYNVNFLQTEYQNAIACGRSARMWNEFESQADALPFLQYQTVGDDRVRPTHAALDNITRKVGDDFWSNYMPPNGWRCRCTVIQLDESEAEQTNLSGFKKPDDVPDIFMFNPGKDKIVFSKEHPYFKIEKGFKDLAKRNFDLPIPTPQQTGEA